MFIGRSGSGTARQIKRVLDHGKVYVREIKDLKDDRVWVCIGRGYVFETNGYTKGSGILIQNERKDIFVRFGCLYEFMG